jgi:HPt (histidine-containing phosphotransfer) domain-containing protein
LKVELELERLAQIQEVMGTGLPELVGGMLDSMRAAIEQVELAMSSGRLDQAAKAAHACRNDALMVGARQLLVALTELETAARSELEQDARSALEALRQAWPATRDALERVAWEGVRPESGG